MYPNTVRTCHHPKITLYCRKEADCEANITDFHCGWCIFSGIFLVYVSFVFDIHSFKLNWNYNFDFHSIALLGFDGNSNSCPFNFPTSYDVKKRIQSVYVNYQAYLCKLFESLEWICVTVDIWSNKHRSYLGMTAHGLDSQTFERISVALCCTRFPHPHTG